MKRSKAYNFFKFTAYLAGLACLVALGVLGAKLYSKNANAEPKSSYQASEETNAKLVKPKETQTEASGEPEADVTVMKTVADILNGYGNEEEAQLQKKYGEDFFLEPKTDDSLFTFSVPREVVDKMIELVNPVPRLKSLTYDQYGKTYVTTSAMAHGYINHEISTALEYAYDSAADDDEGTAEETAITSSNPYAISAWMRGLANVVSAGKKMRDRDPVFNAFIVEETKAYAPTQEKFWEMLEEGDKAIDGDYVIKEVTYGNEVIDLTTKSEEAYNKIPGPGNEGAAHWMYTNEDGELRLTEAYRYYAAVMLGWVENQSYEGVKSWHSVVKSRMTDRKVGQPNFARADFTDEQNRQSDYPSYIFCFRDKNGYRISDFWGINRYTRDFEMYGSGKKTGGGVAYKATDSSQQTISLSYGYKESKTTTKKEEEKKTDKHKEKSSVNKKQNIIDGKDPKGVGTDEFQAKKPETPAETVEQAQHQTQAKESTNPGQEGPTTPPAETTERQTESNVVAYDETQTSDSWTENVTVTTPEIPVQEDKDNDGNDNKETTVVSGFFN